MSRRRPCFWSWLRPFASRSLRSASSTRALASVARAGAVPNREGSRFRNRLRTQAPSGRMSARRRSMSLVSSLVCMDRVYPSDRPLLAVVLLGRHLPLRVPPKHLVALGVALLALALAGCRVLRVEMVRPRGLGLGRSRHRSVGLVGLPVGARFLDVLLQAIRCLTEGIRLPLQLVRSLLILHCSRLPSAVVLGVLARGLPLRFRPFLELLAQVLGFVGSSLMLLGLVLDVRVSSTPALRSFAVKLVEPQLLGGRIGLSLRHRSRPYCVRAATAGPPPQMRWRMRAGRPVCPRPSLRRAQAPGGRFGSGWRRPPAPGSARRRTGQGPSQAGR